MYLKSTYNPALSVWRHIFHAFVKFAQCLRLQIWDRRSSRYGRELQILRKKIDLALLLQFITTGQTSDIKIDLQWYFPRFCRETAHWNLWEDLMWWTRLSIFRLSICWTIQKFAEWSEPLNHFAGFVIVSPCLGFEVQGTRLCVRV